jgi:hypothetical protein
MRSPSKTSVAVISLALVVAVVIGLAVFGSVGRADPADTTQGQLVAVYPDKQTVVITESNGQKQRTFELTRNGQVLINDQPATLEELLAGEYVTVIFEMQSDRLMATEVRCNRF